MKVKVKSLSSVQLFASPWTVAYQAPQSMEFSRQEYWSGLPFLSLGDLPKPGIEPESPALKTDALPSEPPGKPKVCLGGCQLKTLKLWHTQKPKERDCTHLFFKILFLVFKMKHGYSTMLMVASVSTVEQSESDMCISSLPSWISFPLSCHRALSSFLCCTVGSHSLSAFTQSISSAYVSIPIFQFILPSLSLLG